MIFRLAIFDALDVIIVNGIIHGSTRILVVRPKHCGDNARTAKSRSPDPVDDAKKQQRPDLSVKIQYTQLYTNRVIATQQDTRPSKAGQ